MSEHALFEYATIRREYLQRLDEANLLTRDNLIKPELLQTRGLIGPDSPLAELCRQRPVPPICKRIEAREEVEQLVNIHMEYLEELESAELMGVRQFAVDLVGWCGTPPSKWPWPWPPAPGEGIDDHFQDVMALEQELLF